MWWRCLLLSGLVGLTHAEDFPRGQIIDEVKCAADPSQSYALYLPANYSPDRAWSVIFAFDPLARGRAPLVKYEAAAQKYGYIVAGSNNSRNGPWNLSQAAAQAMTADVGARFSIDPKRMYTAGLSGGARVAMAMALSMDQFAGVIASSAGFPDSRPRASVSFPVFATAGTDDFNYLEMRRVDRMLTSPHRLVIFEGGHTWLPSDVAIEAIEWLEVQAMKSGRRAKDEALLEKIFEARKAQAASETGERETYVALAALAADFDGLLDVKELAARAEALAREKTVQQALKNDRAEEQHELQSIRELAEPAAQIDNPAARREALEELASRLKRLNRQATAQQDSAERRRARRVLWGFIMDNRGRSDPELQKLLDEAQPASRP